MAQWPVGQVVGGHFFLHSCIGLLLHHCCFFCILSAALLSSSLALAAPLPCGIFFSVTVVSCFFSFSFFSVTAAIFFFTFRVASSSLRWWTSSDGRAIFGADASCASTSACSFGILVASGLCCCFFSDICVFFAFSVASLSDACSAAAAFSAALVFLVIADGSCVFTASSAVTSAASSSGVSFRTSSSCFFFWGATAAFSAALAIADGSCVFTASSAATSAASSSGASFRTFSCFFFWEICLAWDTVASFFFTFSRLALCSLSTPSVGSLSLPSYPCWGVSRVSSLSSCSLIATEHFEQSIENVAIPEASVASPTSVMSCHHTTLNCMLLMQS